MRILTCIVSERGYLLARCVPWSTAQVVALAPGWHEWQEAGSPLEWHPQDRPIYDSVLLDGPVLGRIMRAGTSSSGLPPLHGPPEISLLQ